MENPKIKTEVVHSLRKTAWNVIGTKLPGKFKIARVPYVETDNEIINTNLKYEALIHAQFISYCFNHSDKICSDAEKGN